MSRYSSDSDSSSRHRKSRRRRSRSSSSSSSDHHRRSSKKSRYYSSSGYRKSKGYSSKSRRRSHSRSDSRSRNSRSVSKDRRRRRSHSRDRYRSKHHHKSRSQSKGHGSRYHSRSSSNDTRSKHSRSPGGSNSSSSSSSKKLPVSATTVNPNSEDQLREKLMKAIKAAESADHQLKQQGVLAKGVKSRNDLNTLTTVKPQSDVIKAIEKDEFVPKTFTSCKSKRASAEERPGLSGLEETNIVPEAAVNSIFHASFFCDPKVRLDRWVKKLYQIRQRAISGEPLAS